MPDTPDDLPKPPRRSTVLPPFFAPSTPRTPRATTPVEKSELPRRRTSHLFTPPSVPRRTRESPAATPPATPATPAAPLAADAEAVETQVAKEVEVPTPPLAATPVPDAPVSPPPSSLGIEQLEQPPIHLTATGEHRAIDASQSFDYIDYSDANRLGDAGTRAPGAQPAIELERTEFTIEPAAAAGRLEIETFWSAEPLIAGAPPAPPAPPEDISAPAAAAPRDVSEALEMERAPDDALAGVSDDATPMEQLEHGAGIGAYAGIEEEPPAEPAARGEIELPSWMSESDAATESAAPVLDDAPDQPTAEMTAESTDAVRDAPLEWIAEPPSRIEPTQDTAVEMAAPSLVDEPPAAKSAVHESAARERAATISELELGAAILGEPAAPAHEASVQSESPAASRDQELAAALAWPASDTPPDDAYALMVGESPADLGAVGDELRAVSRALAAGNAADAQAVVAAALERIALRIRAGELDLPREAASATDESALALTLAALLRGGTRER